MSLLGPHQWLGVGGRRWGGRGMGGLTKSLKTKIKPPSGSLLGRGGWCSASPSGQVDEPQFLSGAGPRVLLHPYHHYHSWELCFLPAQRASFWKQWPFMESFHPSLSSEKSKSQYVWTGESVSQESGKTAWSGLYLVVISSPLTCQVVLLLSEWNQI